MGAALFHGLHYFMPSSHEIMQRSAAALFHRPHHFIAHRRTSTYGIERFLQVIDNRLGQSLWIENAETHTLTYNSVSGSEDKVQNIPTLKALKKMNAFQGNKLHWGDILVIAGYFGVSIGVGLWVCRGLYRNWRRTMKT